MSYLVVIKYDDAAEANAVRKTIKDLSHQGLISLDDAAMVSRGDDGKLHVHNEIDKGVKWGAVIGGGLGLLVAGIFAPVAGIVIGAVAGAGVGAATDHGIQKSFVEEVGESLQSGQSALFMIVAEANSAAALSALGEFQGHVYQTSLPANVEESLRERIGDNEGLSPAEKASRQASSF